MNLMFWKKKPLVEEGADDLEAVDDKTVAIEAPDLEAPTPEKPGVLTRITSGLSGLAGRIKKSPAPEADSAVENHPSKAHDSKGTGANETPALRSMRTKKRLIIGGAIALVILLLTGIGFATWKIFLSSPEHDTAVPAAAEASQNSQPAATAAAEPSETPKAEIEELRKRNEELQAQIEALKKEKPQDQPSASPSGRAGKEASPSPSEGEMTLSNKDPKAAAQILKEAIEAMNATSGRPVRKPENSPPPAKTGGE